MNQNFRRNLLVSSTVSIAILLVSSTASLLSIRTLTASNKWVNHTQEVIFNLNEVNRVLLEAQSSMRGYVITGNRAVLEPYQNAEIRANVFTARLTELTQDNPEQQKLLRMFDPVKTEYFRYLQRRINDRGSKVPTVASDLNTGIGLMSRIKSILDRMEKQEKELLQKRIDDSQRYGAYSTTLIIIAAILAISISLLFFVRMLRDYRERARLYGALQDKDLEISRRITAISGIAGRIAAGDYKVRAKDDDTDSLGEVAGALNNMAGSLDDNFTKLSLQEWHQSGIAELNTVMLGDKDLLTLCADVTEFLCQYTNSGAAALYLNTPDGLLLTGSFSYNGSKKHNLIPLGEGLTGQAAASEKTLELRDLKPGDVTLSYAMGEIKPAHVVALPLMDVKMLGVLEILSVKPYAKAELDFMEAASDNIAIVIKSALNRQRVAELLEETQSQAEELRTQHTELESINAELETQTEKLQASEEELRVQQEELQQTNDELAERSALLEERNLEILKKSEDLELSTRYKSEFLANMSHELRTPLNSILLLSRLLAENPDENLGEEQVEFARVIQNSGKGLLGLIDEILDLSKIEAGKMDLEMLDTPVSDIVESLRELFGPVAREKGIQLEIDTANAPLVLRTDRMRLEQILKNLISNAIKFTSEGSVTLTVKTQPQDERLVEFAVTDTGIGIATEKQPLIFEAFQQADGSTKRKYGGTGLGLSISRELAKLLNGKLALESIPDQGSTFTLTVPVAGQANIVAAEQTQTEPIVSPADATAVPKPYLSRKIPNEIPDDRNKIDPKDQVILIVEDDTAFAKSLLEFTRKRGYKGVVCVRGDQALNFALTYKPVGVLLDIELPLKSGWEVLEDLKGNPRTKPIPVHIMSSHHLKQESLLKGAVNFLDKPVAYEKMPEVFQHIERIINHDAQKVLIIEDNPMHAKALAYFLETHRIASEIKSEINDGILALQKKELQCVILDMGIPDPHAYEILEDLKKKGAEHLPVIVFTGRSLSMKEELKIKKYADSIVVKTAHSYQRMLDEVSLFLHLMEEHKQDGIKKRGLARNVLAGKNVLVVDDDVRNIYSLTKALEAVKMNVSSATDGKEALKVLAENPKTDVVLLDMMMPNMDGYETAQRIRENAHFKTLPVIAVTAKAMTGDREKCINAGASDYITKPVDADQLMSLLRVWLYDNK